MLMKRYPKTGQRGAPQAFARKLYEILEKEPPETVSWNSTGDAFSVNDVEKFSHEILMKYFRHSKFASFQRQLNLYGFRKITRGADAGAYSHQYFHQGRPNYLILVRRSSVVTPQVPADLDQDISETSHTSSDVNIQINQHTNNLVTEHQIIRNQAFTNPFHFSPMFRDSQQNMQMMPLNKTPDNFIFDHALPSEPLHSLEQQAAAFWNYHMSLTHQDKSSAAQCNQNWNLSEMYQKNLRSQTDHVDAQVRSNSCVSVTEDPLNFMKLWNSELKGECERSEVDRSLWPNALPSNGGGEQVLSESLNPRLFSSFSFPSFGKFPSFGSLNEAQFQFPANRDPLNLPFESVESFSDLQFPGPTSNWNGTPASTSTQRSDSYGSEQWRI